MKYPDKLYRKVDYILQLRRQRAGWELEQRVRSIRDYYKNIYTLYQDVQSHGALLGKTMIAGNPDNNQKHMTEQQARVDKLAQDLVTAGLPKDYLQLQPKCKTCRDSGIVGNENCQCRQEILNRLAYEWLSNISQVDHCTFGNFSLRYYEGEPWQSASNMRRAFLPAAEICCFWERLVLARLTCPWPLPPRW